MTQSVTPGGQQCFAYYETGMMLDATDNNNRLVSVSATTATNYNAPTTVTPNSNANLSESMTWTQALGLSTATGPNGASVSALYDLLGRPSEQTTPYGAKTVFTYADASRQVTAKLQNSVAGQGDGRWRRTTFDGFGRTVKVESGDSTDLVNAKSVTETEYDACACSPIGKVKRVSRPYVPGGTKYWTTFTYDALGRTTRIDQPNSLPGRGHSLQVRPAT